MNGSTRAFPQATPTIYGTVYDHGLSVRDYFAAQALAALLVNGNDGNRLTIAREAVLHADALIAALNGAA